MEKCVLDTSALMSCCNIIERLKSEYNIIIPITVIEELDNLKTNRDYERSSKARNAIRHIRDNAQYVEFDLVRRVAKEFEANNIVANVYNMNDDIIVTSAYHNMAYLCTGDLNLQIKAKSVGVPLVDVPSDILYKGYKRVVLTDEQLAYLYEHTMENIYNLNINEYLIIYNDEQVCLDVLKWTAQGHVKVGHKNIKTRMFGNVKAKDEYQLCALDSMCNNDITAIYGRAGSGKTHLALAYLMKLLECGDIRKIYVIFSYNTLKGAPTLGYEKGDHEEKILMTGSIGNILATKFGDINMVKSLMMNGQLEIVPTANIRGINVSSTDSIFITEGQNMDIYTLKTVLQRCEQGCKQVYEGDILEQTDVNISQSGMERMIDVFKDNDCFGCIKLKNSYRSTVTTIADKM